MANFFDLVRKTTAPTSGAITVLSYYKDNATPIQLSVTGASFMKVWINQTATGSITDPEFPSAWIANSTTWIPNFTVEGNNYVHALFADEVGNYVDVSGNPIIVNSTVTVYDKTLPIVTNVSISNDSAVTATRNVTVRVTANDGTGSGIASTTLSGDLDPTSETSFIWSDTDRANGYKDCSVILSNNTVSQRESKTVNATATDRAGNVGEPASDTIVLYTGTIDPVLYMTKPDDSVIGNHYGESQFKAVLEMLVGEASMMNGYKVWGDYSTTEGGTTPTSEPADYTPWGTGTKITLTGLYLTASDGQKTLYSKVRKNVSSAAGTVATKADLPATANDGDIYEVTADESRSGENDYYRYSLANTRFDYFGKKDGSYAECTLDNVSVHHSEAVPTISLVSAKTVISDKEGHNSTGLTSTFTTSCNIKYYKVVAYATQEQAQAGTYVDTSNVDLTGSEEKPTGSTWDATLLESKLITAIAGEGAKYLVVYAQNLCDKWGKSNITPITIDLTAPVGSVTVNNYYKEASGFTASATDANTVSKMLVWVDNTINNETIPAGYSEIDYSENPTADKVNGWTSLTESATCYVHIKYVDSVGNFSFAHSIAFTFDKTAPTGASITTAVRTNTPTTTVNISATDSVSGLGQMKLYGDIDGASTAEVATWQDYSTSANITLTNGDGLKNIYCLIKDKAGNVIATAVSCSTTLDTVSPTATLNLYDKDGVNVLPNKVNEVDFSVRIGATEDLANIAQYKLYGNVQGKEAETSVEWVTFQPDAGQTYMSVRGLKLTTGDGVKTVTVKLKDLAGNVSTAVSQTVTLDTSIPEISISGLDYSKISNKTGKRMTSAGVEIDGTRCDKITFKFSSNQKLVSYKVCVYDNTKTAQEAVAITTTGGSINMSGGTVEANAEVSCTLMDADFKEHSVVSDTDGAYKVIIFGKNEAGSWSASDPITA